MAVLPHFAQSHLLTLTPTPNPLALTHWAKRDWAKWEDTVMAECSAVHGHARYQKWRLNFEGLG